MKTLFQALKDLFSSENEFLFLAKSGKRITHIALAIPLIIVVMLASQIIAYFPGQKIVDYYDSGETFISFYNLFVSFGLVILLIWIWVSLFEKRSFSSLGFHKKNAFKNYFLGFLMGFIMLGTVIILMSIFGSIDYENNPEEFKIELLGTFLLLLGGYVIQGAAEEILVRGWLFQVIAVKYKPWLGAVISSVIFAFLHGLNTGVSALAIVNLLLFAFLLVFLILNHKNIWVACGWHTAWNWTMENIFGLNVSGNEGGDSLLNLTSNGPNLLTGGAFGPEASIFTTIVLLGGMIYILVLSKNKSKA
jgi:membrane protease YdiL (CAAX protease family)